MRSPGVRISKRMRAKLHELKGELMQRRHQPVPEQGRWLASVVHEHCAYYAVPGNSKAVASTHTITCAPRRPGCSGAGTQNRLICAPRPTAPSTLPGVQIKRSGRSRFETPVAQRDDRWSRSPREIRRSIGTA
jgi:hypothetical protein